MKKLYGSFAAKMIAVILLCLLVLAFGASMIGALIVNEMDGYTTDAKSFLNGIAQNEARSYAYGIGSTFLHGGNPGNISTEPNLRFTILDDSGKVLWNDYEGEEILTETSTTIQPDYTVDYIFTQASEVNEDSEGDQYAAASSTQRPVETDDAQAEGEQTWYVTAYPSSEHFTFHSEEDLNAWLSEQTITVKGYVLADLQSYGHTWTRLGLSQTLYSWRFAFLWIAGLSLILGILDFIFLLCAAGHRKGTDEIVPSFVERIPFDVFTLLVIAAIAVFMTPLMAGFDWPEILFALIPCVLLIGLTFLLWCMSFAVRVKLGTLWSGCLTAKILDMIVRGVKHLPILWKWALGIGVLALIDLFFRRGCVFSYNRTHVFWFLCWALIGGATLYAVLAFRRLRKGAKEIASGNMSYSIDEKNLVLDFKDHAHDLNHIRDGLNDAVEQRMKSERFRTELITNVSHDIKTPLTSIVNYVDLLQKEEPKTEKQQEYLEVLSRQSAKLKKLIEDLIEASKASTGNLSVNLQPCDLSVLLDQTAGEYGEKLEKAGMELVLQKPESPVTVMADGRHLWRVFDNLLNNIVKYAMPGTRVYLSLQAQSGEARVTFRNISREPLNLSAAELTERFVQGDASRHADGNGLGLAIAMSLMKLQKGDLDIEVDGDLFKVTLRFPKG